MCLGLTVVKKEFHLFQGITHYILGDDCCNVSCFGIPECQWGCRFYACDF
jgi:hypothetical protein